MSGASKEIVFLVEQLKNVKSESESKVKELEAKVKESQVTQQDY
jgi:hypothetical protein